MKYKRVFKTEINEFFRDFSGLGNILLLITFFLLVIEGKKLIITIAGLFITILICYFIKSIFYKKRPKYMYHSNFLEKIRSASFPSVHSAGIMYSGLVVMYNVNNVIVDVFFLIIILIVGYSRYYLKKHYFKDIIGGYVIGSAVFFLLLP